MFIQRAILPDIVKELDTPEIVVLTGMRRVGKTTIFNYLYSLIESGNKAVFDAENPLHRKLFEEKNYDNIWFNLAEFGITNTERAYIFIDEIQLMPEITSVVKYLYDHYNVKFFLIGSSSFYLKNLFPESLAGRKVLFELFPLTFQEFLKFKGKERDLPNSWAEKAVRKSAVVLELYKEYYKEYMDFGGFPGVVLEERYDRKLKLLGDIFTSYFEHDVKSLADFHDISKVRDLILLLSARVGSKLDITKISSELAVSRQTIYSYISFLEQTYFIHTISKHSGSIDRAAAGSKKLYFCDSGIMRMLGNETAGQALENSVFQSLRPLYDVAYYADKRGAEIDFIVDRAIALEVKSMGSAKDASRLTQLAESIGIKEQYVVSLGYTDHPQIVLAEDL